MVGLIGAEGIERKIRMAKYGMNISEAIQILGGLTVPSELINSVKIAEAMRMAIDALNKQIDIGNLLQEFKDAYNPDNRYSEACVMEFLCDGYMLSEVNNIES